VKQPRVDPAHPDPAVLEAAAALLRAGRLVAFPTETVYGLGAHARDAAAVERIFAAKGRPSFDPLIVHVADAEAARALVTHWPEAADRLAAAFWPGPLTLVLPKRADIPDVVTAGLPSVAVRVPAHPVARALLHAAGIPLAAPSANRYTEVSPTTAAHVAKGLAGRVDMILDGGATQVGIESTVVDLTDAQPRLLRPGSIPLRDLEAVAGPFATAVRPVEEHAPRPSPGMVRRHYAPRAALLPFDDGGRDRAAAAAAAALARGECVGALLLTAFDADIRHVVRMPADPDGYASRLYAALHELDDRGCDLVLVEQVPAGAEWAGVRDRLERAAAHA
jgi:L-threonylcarbamoyladenylate synthase